jgi:hypothetical protein
MNYTWFVPLSYNYFNTYPGGPWDGGTVMNAQLYVYVSSLTNGNDKRRRKG